MKKLLFIPFILLMLACKSQQAVPVSQPVYFLKWIKVHDSVRAPIFFQGTNDTLATQAYARGFAAGSLVQGVGIKISGTTVAIDTANYRKQDSMYVVTDSTFIIVVNHKSYSFKMRGAVFSFAGRIGAVVPNKYDYSPYYLRLDSTYPDPSAIQSLNWTKIFNTPSTLGAYGILDAMKNKGGANTWQTDILANRPASSGYGNFFYATDDSTLFFDLGPSNGGWQMAGGGGGGVDTIYNFSYGLIPTRSGNQVTVKVDTTTLKTVFGAGAGGIFQIFHKWPGILIHGTDTVDADTSVLVRWSDTTARIATRNFVTTRGYLTAESDPIALAKNFTLNVVASGGILRTGAATQTVGAAPTWSLQIDSSVLATHTALLDTAAAIRLTIPAGISQIYTKYGLIINGTDTATVDTTKFTRFSDTTATLATRSFVLGKGYISTETDPIAIAKTISDTAGYGILIGGVTTQTVGGNPKYKHTVDTSVIAPLHRISDTATALRALFAAGGQTLTLGSGLLGTSYNGSAAVTAKVDSSLYATNTYVNRQGFYKPSDTLATLATLLAVKDTAITLRTLINRKPDTTNAVLRNWFSNQTITTNGFNLVMDGGFVLTGPDTLATRAYARSFGGGTPFDSATTQGGGFHTQPYNDIRYRKPYIDSLHNNLVVDSTIIAYLGSSGDSLMRGHSDSIYVPLIRDSIGFKKIKNPDGSWTFTATGNLPLDSVLKYGYVSTRSAKVGGFNSTGGDTLTGTPYGTKNRVLVLDTVTGIVYHQAMQSLDTMGAVQGSSPYYNVPTGTFKMTRDSVYRIPGKDSLYFSLGGKIFQVLDSLGAGGGGSGSVTQVATGFAMLGGPITSTGTVSFDSTAGGSGTGTGSFHTLVFNDTRYRKPFVDSLHNGQIVDSTIIAYLGVNGGDSIVRGHSDTLYVPLIKDSLAFHHVKNPDGSWTLYSTGGGGSGGPYYPPLDSVVLAGRVTARTIQIGGFKNTGADTLSGLTYSNAFGRVLTQDTITGRIYRQSMQTVDTTGLAGLGTGAFPTWNGSSKFVMTGILPGANGGTGVANSGKTITLGGNLTTSGANAVTLTSTGTTNVILPLSGTVFSSQAASITSASLLGAMFDASGTGQLVFNNSPVFTTPSLGTALANSINKVAFTQPASQATLSLFTGSVLATSGTFQDTLTTIGNTNVTLPVSGTLYGTKAGSFSSSQLNTSLSDPMGTGRAVFAQSPTLTLPNIGVATATSVNGLTITQTTGTLTLTNGSTLLTSGAFPLTLSTTASTNVVLPTTGTLYGTATASFSSSNLATSLNDETGSGNAVFSNSPAFVGTPTFSNGSTTLNIGNGSAGTPSIIWPANNTQIDLISGGDIGLYYAGNLIYRFTAGGTPIFANLTQTAPFDTSTHKILVSDGSGNVTKSYWPTVTGSSFYQLVQANTVSATQRSKLNFSTNFGVADNTGNGSTDISITSIPSAATGTTQATNTNNTTLATTAFVQNQIGALPLFYQTVQSTGTSQTQRGKLNFGSGLALTDNSGNNSTDVAISSLPSGVTATTQTTGDNTTHVATTAFVQNTLNANPSIYTQDGSLSGNRTVNTGTSYLDFVGNAIGTGTVILNSPTFHGGGIQMVESEIFSGMTSYTTTYFDTWVVIQASTGQTGTLTLPPTNAPPPGTPSGVNSSNQGKTIYIANNSAFSWTLAPGTAFSGAPATTITSKGSTITSIPAHTNMILVFSAGEHTWMVMSQN